LAGPEFIDPLLDARLDCLFRLQFAALDRRPFIGDLIFDAVVYSVLDRALQDREPAMDRVFPGAACYFHRSRDALIKGPEALER